MLSRLKFELSNWRYLYSETDFTVSEGSLYKIIFTVAFSPAPSYQSSLILKIDGSDVATCKNITNNSLVIGVSYARMTSGKTLSLDIVSLETAFSVIFKTGMGAAISIKKAAS